MTLRGIMPTSAAVAALVGMMLLSGIQSADYGLGLQCLKDSGICLLKYVREGIEQIPPCLKCGWQ